MHDTFDWAANIWIPAASVLVSLLVSGASLAVALAALRIARGANDLERSKTELEQRQWRHGQLPALQQWLRDMAHEADDAPVWEKIKVVQAGADLDKAMSARGDEQGVDMLTWLRWQVRQAPAGMPRSEAEANGSVMIDDWAVDPKRVETWINWPDQH